MNASKSHMEVGYQQTQQQLADAEAELEKMTLENDRVAQDLQDEVLKAFYFYLYRA